MASKIFPIATRRSPLAQAQAKIVAGLLADICSEQDTTFPLKTFVSTGDIRLEGALADVGGKGLFTKEIEQALLSGAARIAVHSMKDMPAEMPPGLILGAIPVRENPCDALIVRPGLEVSNISDLPEGVHIGTASVRRAAQILRLRPDVQISPLRGNIGRRLEKLNEAEIDATFLAEAGLVRGQKLYIKRTVLDPDQFLPAIGQGALCLQIRQDDAEAQALLRLISCPRTELCLAVERAFLARLDGSCKTPMAGLAEWRDNEIVFRAEILSLDGQDHLIQTHHFVPSGGTHVESLQACEAVGVLIAEEMIARAPTTLLQHLGLQENGI